MFQLIKNTFLNILFPPVCLGCNKHLQKEECGIVCQQCSNSIEVNRYLHCPICLNRLTNINNSHCHPITKYLLAAAGNYENLPTQKLLWQFKYHGWLSAAQPLAELLTIHLHHLANNYKINLREFTIVPIPLHQVREVKRGFNQSSVLANIVAQNFNLPVVKDALMRIHETKSQAELENYRQREENVRGAFMTNEKNDLRGKNIILIDDVFTSGATINEAVRVLKLADAKKIIALVVARAR